jgi:hypothetical protein
MMLAILASTAFTTNSTEGKNSASTMIATTISAPPEKSFPRNPSPHDAKRLPSVNCS